MTEMQDEEIRTIIGRKLHAAMNDEDGDLSDNREDALNYYIGAELGNERDGYSKYRTREFMETVEWVLPSVLRVFTSGDKVVTFDAVGSEDEEAAQQETDVANHKVMKANGGDGFLALHAWFKDALMNPNAYVKIYVDETTRVETEEYKGQSPIQLSMLMEDDDVEIISQDSYMEQIQTPQGVMDVELFNVECKRTINERKLKVDPVPPEQALIDNDCMSPNLDGNADFICHRVRKNFTQLVNEGFDKARLEAVGSVEDYTFNDETTGRLFYEDENPDNEDEDVPGMREYWVHECYMNLDVDGDGLAEYRQIIMIGAEIFENDECSYQPMVSLSSILMSHKHNGMSLFDVVKDIQDLKTTLVRQLLDNVYKMNVNKKYVSDQAILDDGSTTDAMLNTQTEYVPIRGIPSNAVFPEQHQSIIGELLPVIAHVDDSRTMRTGVSPNNALDPDVLQKSTMGAFMAGLEKASERIEMLVRIFAETGVKTMMRKTHQLIRMYPDIAQTVKLRGEWIDVDPAGWRDRTDMTVNVGLGFNNKQQQVGMAVQLLEIQREAMGAGLADKEEIFNTLEKLINVSAFGDVNEYFIKPGSEKDQRLQEQQQMMAQNQPEDPAMMVAASQSKANEVNAQTKAQEVQAKSQLEAQKQQDDHGYRMAQLENEREKRVLDAQKIALDREKIALERDKTESVIDLNDARAIQALANAEAAEEGQQLPEMVERSKDPDFEYIDGKVVENA